jgi:hypothetical protein
MADRRLKIWYDGAGDYLEVMFEDRAGYYRETADDRVMAKVDDRGSCAAAGEHYPLGRLTQTTMSQPTQIFRTDCAQDRSSVCHI